MIAPHFQLNIKPLEPSSYITSTGYKDLKPASSKEGTKELQVLLGLSHPWSSYLPTPSAFVVGVLSIGFLLQLIKWVRPRRHLRD